MTATAQTVYISSTTSAPHTQRTRGQGEGRTHPATTSASFNEVPLLLIATKTSPPRPWGTVQAPPWRGANRVPASPAVKVQNMPSWAPATPCICITEPALILAVSPTTVSGGNATSGSADPAGHDVMNADASVKICRGPIATSNACGTPATPNAPRRNVWCRASTVTMEAAADSIALAVTSGAAPRYLCVC